LWKVDDRPVYRVAQRRGSINFPPFYHWLGILSTHYKIEEQEGRGGEGRRGEGRGRERKLTERLIG